uniref:Proteasome inhibitor subunit 1 n=1 Tax=Pelodiscus sinensis TaxID=13735 RepID=K7GE40_PELSI
MVDSSMILNIMVGLQLQAGGGFDLERGGLHRPGALGGFPQVGCTRTSRSCRPGLSPASSLPWGLPRRRATPKRSPSPRRTSRLPPLRIATPFGSGLAAILVGLIRWAPLLWVERTWTPLGRGRRGGMISDPLRSGFRRPPFNPSSGLPSRLPPGAVPPGARFDPFGPGRGGPAG